MADGDEEEGFFVLGAVQDVAEEAHGAGRVGEGGEAGHVAGGEKESAGQPDGLKRVIVLVLYAIDDLPVDAEDGDEPGHGFEEGLGRSGAERLERFEPFGRHAVLVALVLLGFGGDANLALDGGVADRHEAPRLAIGVD